MPSPLGRQMVRQSGVTVSGKAGVIANLGRYSDQVRRECVRVTRRAGVDVRRLAREVCPVRTGRMRNSITTEYSHNGLAFETFYDPEPFLAEGLAYYPIFVELGTSMMPARPTLRWAWDQIGPDYNVEIRQALRRLSR